MSRKVFWQIVITTGLAAALFGLSPRQTSAQVGIGVPPAGGGGTGGTTTTGTLTITLPAKELLTPDQLQIGNPGNTGTQTFTFNPGSGQFSPTTAGAYTVTTTTHYDSSGSDNGGRSLAYTIKVEGFKKGGGQLALNDKKGGNLLASLETTLQKSVTAQAFAPPFPCFAVCAKIVFPYRLTFKSGSGSVTLPKAAVASYQQFITTFPHHNELTDTYICRSDGTLDSSGGYLCLKENVKFDTTERGTTGPLYTLQAIPLGVTGAITIQGNAAASGTIGGFNFNAISNAIAVGGNIPDPIPNANKTLQNYISQNATKFSWTNVQPQLNALFAKRTKGTIAKLDVTGTLFNAATWNLNSSTDDPANPAQNSFSTPPEGKLWYTQSTSFLRFPNNINFSGSGTIAVNGPIEFDGTVTCSPGTRLGIIATGAINFLNPTIGCGAYTTLSSSSDIVFSFQVPSNGLSANGIFVAGHSIHLPSLVPTASYSINYDNVFGASPTVLYQELLKVVFSTSN